MLDVYTRHASDCEHSEDMRCRRWRCPKWLRGVLPNGDVVRESAQTRSWEQAERKAREREAAADPNAPNRRSSNQRLLKKALHCF